MQIVCTLLQTNNHALLKGASKHRSSLDVVFGSAVHLFCYVVDEHFPVLYGVRLADGQK